MKHLFKQPFFYTTILSLVTLGLIVASYVFGWTTPTASPPAGNVTLSSSQWTTSGTNIYYNGGNVGIGTSTPAQTLSVAGVIESISGGFKFPDGSILTSANSTVPNGMIAMFSTACPTGWVQLSGFTGKLPMAGASYGSTGNITGTSGTSPLASYINVVFCAKGGIIATAPQNLTATGITGQITLNWSAPSDNGGSAITNYKIYRGTSSGGETYFTTVGNVLTYTDTGLTTGSFYCYKVTAVNSIGESNFSNEVCQYASLYCDNDGDGHYTIASQTSCTGAKRNSPAGDDCLDSDKNVYPGQTAWFTTPRADGGWDYNCDGSITQQYTVIANLSGCFSSNNNTTNHGGWATTVPACGVTAQWVQLFCTGDATCASGYGSYGYWSDTNYAEVCNFCYLKGLNYCGNGGGGGTLTQSCH